MKRWREHTEFTGHIRSMLEAKKKSVAAYNIQLAQKDWTKCVDSVYVVKGFKENIYLIKLNTGEIIKYIRSELRTDNHLSFKRDSSFSITNSCNKIYDDNEIQEIIREARICELSQN